MSSETRSTATVSLKTFETSSRRTLAMSRPLPACPSKSVHSSVGPAQRVDQDVEPLLQVAFGDHKWRQYAHDVVVGPGFEGEHAVLEAALHDRAGLELRRLLG